MPLLGPSPCDPAPMLLSLAQSAPPVQRTHAYNQSANSPAHTIQVQPIHEQEGRCERRLSYQVGHSMGQGRPCLITLIDWLTVRALRPRTGQLSPPPPS